MNLLKFIFAYLSLCLLELMTENSVLCLFVKEVKYSDLLSKNVNSDYCGLTSVPIVAKINFPKNCFINIRDNITVVIPIKGQEKMSVESRMFNAEAADPNEAPWAVLLKEVYLKRVTKMWDPLEIVKHEEELCGGSLITFEWVLTAAHCLDEHEKIWVDVWAELSRVNVWESPGQIRFGIRQQNFYRHSEEDIALIKLPHPFTEKKDKGRFSVNTICLPQKTRYSNEEVENAVMFSAGKIKIPKVGFWDWFEEPPWRGWANNLKKGKFIIQPYRVCEGINRIPKYRKVPQIWNKMLCSNTTMSRVVTTCPGDSGSGLVQYTNRFNTRAILFGVLNGAIYPGETVCDDKVEYPYWAAVSVHIDWILKTIRNN